MLLSVVIPFYKYKNYLKECLNSLLNSSFHDFETILVLDHNEENNNFLKEHNSSPLTGKIKLIDLVKRPEIELSELLKHIGYECDKEIIEMVETDIKYEGYINKTKNEVKKMLKLEEKQIPSDIDYSKVKNIATEARQKFEKIRPLTIGQASRISGVNPSDITMLLVYLKKEYNNE